jgi:hypothetical protein
MRTAISVIAMALMLAGCTTVTPVAIRSGDTCFRCRQPIVDVRLAAEIIDTQGHAFKFKSVGCVSQYLAANPGDLKGIFVTDYVSGKLVRAEAANFVRAEINPNTREMDYLAFSSVTQAVEQGKKAGSSPVDWLTVMRLVKAS